MLKLFGMGASNSPSPPVSSPPARVLNDSLIFEHVVLPFVDRIRAGKPTFSLLEHGSWHGLFSIAVGTEHPRGTIVMLEPSQSMWSEHHKQARDLSLANVFFAHNTLTEQVAEALSHSNEFFDGQLLLSLRTAQPFRAAVKSGMRKRLDLYVAHLLSLARRSLLMLPAPAQPAACTINRLSRWFYGRNATGEATFSGRERISAAASALSLRVSATKLLGGSAADRCEYDVWEVKLLHMDRTNRHHFCVGGCKTHTRRTYRMIYDAVDERAGSSSSVADLVHGSMNMTNTQTGRHIPFETGSMNMHTLLSLQGTAKGGIAAGDGKDGGGSSSGGGGGTGLGATVGSTVRELDAAEAARQALILMFLSLPVFQDPAPWNVVWRAGELFPIDVGDGLTMEQRPVVKGQSPWDVFAQKYIGSVSECYRMSLKHLCGFVPSESHGDERYASCMAAHFSGSLCTQHSPFPCLQGCGSSYRSCNHLQPAKVVPGWFAASSPYLRKHEQRFRQFLPNSGASDAGLAGLKWFGSHRILENQYAYGEAARRKVSEALPASSPAEHATSTQHRFESPLSKAAAQVNSGVVREQQTTSTRAERVPNTVAPSREHAFSSGPLAREKVRRPPPSPLPYSFPRSQGRTAADGRDVHRASDVDSTGGGLVQRRSEQNDADGDGDVRDIGGSVEAGLHTLLTLRGIRSTVRWSVPHEARRGTHTRTDARASAVPGQLAEAAGGVGALSLLQLALLLWVVCQLWLRRVSCPPWAGSFRYPLTLPGGMRASLSGSKDRQLSHDYRAHGPRCFQPPGRNRVHARHRAHGMDSRLLGEMVG